jgi:hypothetical protein
MDIAKRAVDEWLDRMRRGDFEGAWGVSDLALAWRPPADAGAPRHEQRIWDGSPLAGRRVLVRCYHGLGDTIQFLRYLPALGRLAREVTVWIQPELIPLLSSTPNLGRLLPLHDGTPDVDFEVDIEIMELPHAFRTVERTIPCDVPYIHVARVPVAPSPLPRVGLVWTAGSWDPRRSVPFWQFQPILDTTHARFRPLQLGIEAEAVGRFGAAPDAFPLRALAEQVAAQDLIITVDTMMAHLAGALGVPTWLLLHADADWRWMRGRHDTPWYPATRLYRQTRAGDWHPVIAAVRQDLDALCTSSPRAQSAPET